MSVLRDLGQFYYIAKHIIFKKELLPLPQYSYSLFAHADHTFFSVNNDGYRSLILKNVSST